MRYDCANHAAIENSLAASSLKCRAPMSVIANNAANTAS
jgi:hypothetical protein